MYKSEVTQERINISEKAHIYAFSENGPRGKGVNGRNKALLNNISNLMLVCHSCHKTIDADKEGKKYSVELLQKWKKQHEQRIKIVTGINSDKKSYVVIYGANIGEEKSPIKPESCVEAMFPEYYPADENPINLSMNCSHEDHSKNYWETESTHLKTEFERYIRPRIKEFLPCHFSLFGLAPQPLLILLGSLFTDKIPVEVYQLHREPCSWKWQNQLEKISFEINEPKNTSYDPVLILSLSSKIHHNRIFSVISKKVSIWELTINECHNDFLKSYTQLSMFRTMVRKIISLIQEKHNHTQKLRIFPAIPVSCAIELGRIRMPKADMPWIIYDQNNKANKFIETIQIA